MEGNADVHDYVENAAETTQIKRKEDGQQQLQSENCVQFQNRALVFTEGIGWTEHLSSLRSPEKLLETLADNGINCGSGAHSITELPSTSSSPSNFTETATEGLTAKSIDSTIVSRNACSGIGEIYPIRKGFWQNWTRIAGGTRIDSLHKDLFRTCGRVNVTKTDVLQSLLKNPVALSNCGITFPRTNDVGEEEAHNQNLSRKFIAEHPPGIRTKNLMPSGFQQLVLKSNLKGKGVVNQGTINIPEDTAQSHSVMVTNSKSMHKQIKKANEMLVVGCESGPAGPYASSLREWIRQKQDKSSRLERLYIFKQILDLVDTSHLEGVILQHLRPSYFVVSPTSVVKYVGSFLALGEANDLVVSANQDVLLEPNMKRMRCMQHDREFQTLQSQKHLKLRHDPQLHGMSASKYPGHGEKNEAVVQQHVHPSRSALKGRLTEGIHDVSIKRNSYDSELCDDLNLVDPFLGWKISRCTSVTFSDSNEPDSRFLNLEEKWYTSPEEMNGISCQLSSNIYSLGVLFFELFCDFEAEPLQYAAMSNLQHRILPSCFLSEFFTEAGFCLWLLHPDPSSRPKSRQH
ncbi:hypothetical protein HPP92_025824 [Vanilla planifolia]|uniref:Protein kinase domain-containing protein n=1 Tax=Vanilla planifolia TaxID=51239 RepID=A0A835U771_VANPL|nr:hypothetical protein HPP92_026120 [Vanilla planifolia]KAG0452184.1 hypothetical protein HPP92_025824 [Vanilla planifolia]